MRIVFESASQHFLCRTFTHLVYIKMDHKYDTTKKTPCDNVAFVLFF